MRRRAIIGADREARLALLPVIVASRMSGHVD
jgi:hypothetical protein